MSLPLFCYGTLMVPDIMKRVTGRNISPGQTANLENYGCFKVKRETFPGIRPTDGATTQGLIYHDITHEDIIHLDRYEGFLYERTQVSITTENESLKAWCYLIKPEYFSELLPEHWNYQHFLDNDLSTFTRC